MQQTIPNDIYFGLIEEQLSEGLQVSFLVNGVSMQPLIRNGIDTVKLAPVSAERQPRVMDTVLFRYNGHHVLHRILKIDGTHVIIRGDNLRISGYEECQLTDILGIVTAVVKADGSETPTQSLRWRLLSHLHLAIKSIFLPTYHLAKIILCKR